MLRLSGASSIIVFLWVFFYKFNLLKNTLFLSFGNPILSYSLPLSLTLSHLPSRMRMGGPSVQDGRGGERKTERKVVTQGIPSHESHRIQPTLYFLRLNRVTVAAKPREPRVYTIPLSPQRPSIKDWKEDYYKNHVDYKRELTGTSLIKALALRFYLLEMKVIKLRICFCKLYYKCLTEI